MLASFRQNSKYMTHVVDDPNSLWHLCPRTEAFADALKASGKKTFEKASSHLKARVSKQIIAWTSRAEKILCEFAVFSRTA
eukprot:1901138-Amphidinium_carterae.1